MSRSSVAILAPGRGSDGGVERYCQILAEALESSGYTARVFLPSEPVPPAAVVITNGMLSVRTKVPRIHVFHGCWWHHSRVQRWGGPLVQWKITAAGVSRELKAGRGATRVAVSRRAALDVSSAYRLRVDQVIANPVDVAKFTPGSRRTARESLHLPTDARIALSVGRDETLKRLPLAQRAASRAGYCLATAGNHALGDFPLGTLTTEEMVVAMRAADVLLVASAYEGATLVALESLACGTPVVSTRVGWMPELVERVPTYRELTAEVDDEDALVAALGAVGRSPHQAVSEAHEIVVREHSLPAFADAWDRLVGSVLGSR